MNALDRQNPESLSTAGGSCSGRLWSRDRAIWRGNAARCVALLDRNIACKNVLTKSRRRRARSGQPTFTSKGYTILPPSLSTSLEESLTVKLTPKRQLGSSQPTQQSFKIQGKFWYRYLQKLRYYQIAINLLLFSFTFIFQRFIITFVAKTTSSNPEKSVSYP